MAKPSDGKLHALLTRSHVLIRVNTARIVTTAERLLDARNRLKLATMRVIATRGPVTEAERPN